MATLPLFNAYEESYAFSYGPEADLGNNADCVTTDTMFDNSMNTWTDDAFWGLQHHDVSTHHPQLPTPPLGSDAEQNIHNFLNQDIDNIFDFDNSVNFIHIPQNDGLFTPCELHVLDTSTSTNVNLGADYFSIQPQKQSEDIRKEDVPSLKNSSSISSASSTGSPPLRITTPTHQTFEFPPPTPYTTPEPRNNAAASPPKQRVSSPGTTLSRTPATSPLMRKRPQPPPRTSQRAHYHIEKRYRASLNDKFDALRLCLLRARAYLAIDYKPGSEAGSPLGENAAAKEKEQDAEGNEGGTVVQKTNKSGVLTEALEYIQHLERQNGNCRDRVEELEAHIKAIREGVGKEESFAMDLTSKKEEY